MVFFFKKYSLEGDIAFYFFEGGLMEKKLWNLGLYTVKCFYKKIKLHLCLKK